MEKVARKEKAPDTTTDKWKTLTQTVTTMMRLLSQ
jgi:hypothetical protein